MDRPVDGLLERTFELTDQHKLLAHEMLASINATIRVSRAMMPNVDVTDLGPQTFIIESIAQLALGLVNSSMNEGLLKDVVSATDFDGEWQTRMEKPE